MSTTSDARKVELTWLGQMGLLVKAGGKVLCVDFFATPLEGRQTPPPVKADALTGVDVFLGTHDHIDHIDHDAWKVWARTNPQAKFVFPRAHAEAVAADGVAEENAIGLNDGETYQFGDITIHAAAAAHEFLDRDEKTGLYPHLQYIIEANGVRIHHAGDTVRYEGMLAKITEHGPVDVQLLPIDGRSAEQLKQGLIGNMTYQEAADLAGDAGTRIVIPGHWDMFANNGEDPQLFADYIAAKYAGRIECRIPRVAETIEVYAR